MNSRKRSSTNKSTDKKLDQQIKTISTDQKLDNISKVGSKDEKIDQHIKTMISR